MKGKKTGGRRKGTPNKFTSSLKEMILKTLAMAGGEDYLLVQTSKNPTAFLSLLGRVLPLEVKEAGADPMVPTTVNHHIYPPQ